MENQAGEPEVQELALSWAREDCEGDNCDCPAFRPRVATALLAPCTQPSATEHPKTACSPPLSGMDARLISLGAVYAQAAACMRPQGIRPQSAACISLYAQEHTAAQKLDPPELKWNVTAPHSTGVELAAARHSLQSEQLAASGLEPPAASYPCYLWLPPNGEADFRQLWQRRSAPKCAPGSQRELQPHSADCEKGVTMSRGDEQQDKPRVSSGVNRQSGTDDSKTAEQKIQPPKLASKPGADGRRMPQSFSGAEPGQEPFSTSSVRRIQSSDLAYIEPGTGRAVKYGPAMAHKVNTAELPCISALFRRVQSGVYKRGPPSPAPRLKGTHGVKTHSRRGKSTASPQTGDSPGQPKPAPLEGRGVRCQGAMLTAEEPLQAEAAAGAANIAHTALQAAGPLQPTPTAGPEAPTRVFDLSQSPATEHGRSSGHARAPIAAPPCDQVGKLPAEEHTTGDQPHNAALPHAKGFGSIVGGVLQAAMSSEVPGVFRIEDMHQRAVRRERFQGVRRESWGIAWTAFVPATATKEEQVLGTFQDVETAARVHDVAVLRLQGRDARRQALNFSAESYGERQMQAVRQAPVSEFLASLHQYGLIGSRRNSRFQGVHKTDDKKYEARVREEEG